jgi:hypothetical protein
MDSEKIKIRLGIYFTAVNIGAIIVAGLILFKFGVIAGIASFFTVVTVLIFIIQKKTVSNLEEDIDSSRDS